MQTCPAIRFFIVVVVGLSTIACNSWRKIETDTPWGASGKQVEKYERRATSLIDSLIAPATYYETSWVDRGIRFDPRQIAQSAEDYLYSTDYGAVLATNYSAQPWKTIVCIEPAIALLVPSDPIKANNGWLLGTNQSGESIGPWKHGSGFRYGSVVMYNHGVRWFSPDLRLGPELVVFSTNGLARISFQGGSLELLVQGEICRVIRK